MSCVKEIGDFQQMAPNIPHTVCSQSSFFFYIPELITLPSTQDIDCKEAAQPLPPSIRVAKKPSIEWLTNKTTGVCDVMYHIEACFFKSGRAVSGTRREIILFPILEMPPPMNFEDLKADYILSSMTTFGNFWKRNSGTVISGSSAEPQPFAMHIMEGQNLVTGTDLMLNFSSKTSCAASAPQFTTCEIILTLESTTYFQEHEQKSVMSVEEVQNKQLTILKTARFQPQTCRMRLEHWKRFGEETCK
jgi:hypothetical protein